MRKRTVSLWIDEIHVVQNVLKQCCFFFYNDSVEEKRLMVIDFWLNIMCNVIRILRWIDDEVEKIGETNGVPLQFVVLELSREL